MNPNIVIKRNKGKLFIVSGPSGVGKGTIREKVLSEFPNLVFSVSATTRSKRAGEIEGKDYIFVTKERFKEMINNNEFLEWVEVYGDYYGTPASPIENAIFSGNDAFLEIEIQGARKVKNKYKNTVSIFIAPPSFEELVKRLKGRHTENENALKKRIENARIEMEEYINYDYMVINDTVDLAAKKVNCIILSEKIKIPKEDINNEI